MALDRIDEPVTEYRATTVEEFWEVLSPQINLFGSRGKPIFRGQAEDCWRLEPSILRNDSNHNVYSSVLFRGRDQSENIIFSDIAVQVS
jgi:hypothetical protein